MDFRDLEKYSSAVTLSDMEVFVFPELMYSLVLANIMSPAIWKWRDQDCFKKLEGKSPWRRLMRMRQYIMDEYEFNLDLNTWGLTHKDIEMRRFKPWLSPEQIARSNALFGYEGDKYYFDVDIRRHFGLDQYEGDIIPYWKTETVEAMNAFRLKEGYNTGAGECVSLSTLYAAAAFIICGIPLDDIYMVLTPLHSQNYIDIQDGVITNNRRLVTKSMWFNGTEISNKAQRAIRNEQVTIVAHSTGQIHCLYPDATIDRRVYEQFCAMLRGYLSAELNALNVANFLRSNPKYNRHFQFCRYRRGERMFIKAEVLFGYEHGSRFRIYDETFEKLLDEVNSEDYSPYKHNDRICCEQLMAFIEYEKIDIHNPDDRYKLARFISPFVPEAEQWVADLLDFLHIEPKLPKAEDKQFHRVEPIVLNPDWSREEVIDYLERMRDTSPVADLAFYAYRDMARCDWRPFVKAAIERSPVSAEKTEPMTAEQIHSWLTGLPGASIYDGTRLAQPDEVANYHTGDGIEKAFLMASVLSRRGEQKTFTLTIRPDKAKLTCPDGKSWEYPSTKGLRADIHIDENGCTVETS
ncbi:MAG TPA: hypothetical protein ENN97_07255 [Phycisphaerales bacterium]|nr:hypothetical protein [Phycisphaerales bacterium]